MSVTAAAGFRAAGVAAGLKPSGALDVALVVNDGPLDAAAGVFTANRVAAAPVTWTRSVVALGSVRAVLLNSGCANACTGAAGYADTVATARAVGLALDVAPEQVAVASTGLIGARLPMPQLLAGVTQAVAGVGAGGRSADDAQDAARAIMTTDTRQKTARATSAGFTVGGMAKGAGMLAPGLATMLAVLTTDAVVSPQCLDRALRAASAATFDRVDSDGCMSTNDTVLLLASGASGVTPPPDVLDAAVRQVSADLAAQLVADAEGASKEIAITVTHAATESDALQVARTVARNNLVKCALHGEDPNWGRVLAAVGTTSAQFAVDQLGVAINDVWVVREGAPHADRSLVDLSQRQVRLVVDLGAGDAQATIWTNDLTAAYVHENSAYAT
jgi:glutamate N-acetyltransferase / amino-acid N-acetyltransferase